MPIYIDKPQNTVYHHFCKYFFFEVSKLNLTYSFFENRELLSFQFFYGIVGTWTPTNCGVDSTRW